MNKEQLELCKRLFDLDDKRETLEGTKIVELLRVIKSTEYAVNRNFEELSLAIAKYEKNSGFWKINQREKTIFFRELSRLLHNYLSSAFSLIRHTARFSKKYPKIKNEYDDKINNDFNSNDCAIFVKNDLRDITQHVELPSLVAHFSREHLNKKFKRSIILEKQSLMKNKLSPSAKRYIDSNPEIDLKVTLDKYQCLIRDFYEWFYRRVGQVYSKELEEFGIVNSEIRKIQAELFPKNVRMK